MKSLFYLGLFFYIIAIDFASGADFEDECLKSSPVSVKFGECSVPVFENGVYMLSRTSTNVSTNVVVSSGESITSRCSTGYEAINTVTLTCRDNGEWDPKTCPICRITCPDSAMRPVANGIYFRSDMIAYPRVGVRRYISCNPGYYMANGRIFSSCLNNGTWSRPGRCMPYICDTKTLPKLQNAYFSYDTTYEEYPKLSSVDYICDDALTINNTLANGANVTCLAGSKWSSPTPCSRFRLIDCEAIRAKNASATSGIYEIYPNATSNQSVSVYCDFTTLGGDWTVIQRRVDGSVSFNRRFSDYKTGFGDLSANVWLGLDIINQITTLGRPAGSYSLIIAFSNLTDYGFAYYPGFFVDSEANQYRLRFSSFKCGNYSAALDAMTFHLNQPFSTSDRDLDSDAGDCASSWGGGWWYTNCYHSNLNGIYAGSGFTDICWGNGCPMRARRVAMMIRRRPFVSNECA